MRIWAISDLHLGFSTGKWMHVFGDHWARHHEKIEESWRAEVDDDDIVLVPGDLSWAMKPVDVEPDLAWLAALPGSKVLIKGNHDYWWPSSHARLEALLPDGVYAIKKRSLVLKGVPLIGVRGPDFALRNGESPAELDKRLARERRELLQSMDDLNTRYAGARKPLCLFHYPPYPVGAAESAFTRMVEDAGCSHCIFGHLHTAAEHQRVFQGERRGVAYRLVSCDYLGFRPVLLDEVDTISPQEVDASNQSSSEISA
jgi:predicted phosphohydrolase